MDWYPFFSLLNFSKIPSEDDLNPQNKVYWWVKTHGLYFNVLNLLNHRYSRVLCYILHIKIHHFVFQCPTNLIYIPDVKMISFVQDHELCFSDLSYSMILDLWIVSHWNHRDFPFKGGILTGRGHFRLVHYAVIQDPYIYIIIYIYQSQVYYIQNKMPKNRIRV
jgi:hypothetical protein